MLSGQFDIIGFDPRGINLTRPYVSCFANAAEEQLFMARARDFRLDLPVTLEKYGDVRADAHRQLEETQALTDAMAAKCIERTGDALRYMGTDFVVRDIDRLSQIIEGKHKRINYMGFSYGTIVGQYLIKILPPARLGRIIIDGVVNPDVWASFPTSAFEEGLDNIDDVVEGFASHCHAAGDRCALGSFTKEEILDKIDGLIDDLYENPRAVTDLSLPAVATAANIRQILFSQIYGVSQWAGLADHFKNAFAGNFTGIVNATQQTPEADGFVRPDSSDQAGRVIACSDTKQYNNATRPPSVQDLSLRMFETMNRYSRRLGDKFLFLAFCPSFDKVLGDRHSRYGGSFEMEDDVLDTPILILTKQVAITLP